MASADKSLSNCKTSSENIKQRFNRLYNHHQDIVDVSFILGSDEDQQRVSAHKMVLAVKSEVFKTMFFGKIPESNEVFIPDIELEAFLTLLNFLYFNKVIIDSIQLALDTLNASKKYMVPELENHCVEFLKKALNSKNACFLLTQADLYDKPDLADACLDVIDKNTMEALETDDFTDIDWETLILIFKRDTLEVFEIQLFEAMVKWSKAACVRKQLEITPENQRSVLDKAITLIRFNLMTLKEFTTGPIQSDLLQYDEVKQYSLDIVSNGNPIGRPRCCQHNFEMRLNFCCDLKNVAIVKTTFHKLKIKKSIYIIGFIVNNIPEDYYSKFVIKKNNEEIAGNYFASSLDTTTFIFNKPIMFIKDEKLQVKINFRSTGYHSFLNIYTRSVNGTISRDGSEKKMNDYFEWEPLQSEKKNIICEMIFYDC